MATRIAFRMFLLCLFACATMAIAGIWTGEHILPPAYFQTAATLFILGLASFLIWFTRTLLDIRRSVQQ